MKRAELWKEVKAHRANGKTAYLNFDKVVIKARKNQNRNGQSADANTRTTRAGTRGGQAEGHDQTNEHGSADSTAARGGQ